MGDIIAFCITDRDMGLFLEACIGSWTHGSSLVATDAAKALMYQSHSPKLKEGESGAARRGRQKWAEW
jgi:hypothetical protein